MNQDNVLTGLRTYLMGAGIIVHQIMMHFGYDVSNELISQTIDAILAGGAIFFRWVAAKNTRKAVVDALYMQVPVLPKPEVK